MKYCVYSWCLFEKQEDIDKMQKAFNEVKKTIMFMMVLVEVVQQKFRYLKFSKG